MKILHLTLKKKWFDMIGDPKTEEYRDNGAWIRSRLMDKNGDNKHYDVVQFRNGYSLSSPTKTFEYKGFVFDVGEEAWGAPPRKVFIIKLGKQL